MGTKNSTTGVLSAENETSHSDYARLADSPKFIPILFSTAMVQAILDGRKVQTRRIIKKQPNLEKHTHINRAVVLDGTNTEVFNYCSGTSSVVESVKCPYGQPGDILWVRETFVSYNVPVKHPKVAEIEYEYKADESPIKFRWKPGIHMPKDACRVFLKVKSVRIERLGQINRGDAMAEGCPFPNIAKETNPVAWFASLWQKINGFKSWNDNPFVWVIEFERIERPTGFL